MLNTALMKVRPFCSLLILFALSPLALQAGENSDNSKRSDNPAMLDFWVGEWDLTWKNQDGEEAKGSNTIRKVLGGAVVHENFNGDPGMDFYGQSFSVLSRADGSWKQVWVDSERGYLDFDGYQQGDKVVFHRIGKNPQGQTLHQRMTFHDIEKNSFTWDWETSPDGREWSLRWRIHYKRQK